MNRDIPGKGLGKILFPLKTVAIGLAAWLAFACWSPPPVSALDPDSASFVIGVSPADIYPPENITDLRGVPSGIAGQAVLQWTAPVESSGVVPTSVAVVEYDLRLATFSIADVGASTTTWFAAASSMTTPTPATPGVTQFAITSLEPATTYYFAIRSRDDANLESELDVDALAVVTQTTVGVKGIQGITDLTALTGSDSGEIDLSWTSPSVIGDVAPLFYDFRVSSSANILTDAEFTLAAPLSAVSPSTPIAGGTPGLARIFTVTGLTPAVTYYFAVSETDSGVPFTGIWRSSAALDINAFNSARASFIPNPAEAITNLSALPGIKSGGIRLAWTAPRNLNGVAIDRYEIHSNTTSVADLGGDFNAWFNLSTSTRTFLPDISAPGVTLSTEIGGHSPLYEHFFGIVSYDITGQVSPIDLLAQVGATQARSFSRPAPPVINLSAFPGIDSGSIRLAWTIPSALGLTDPRGYDIRVSSLANINDDVAFDAAQPLSNFSPSPIPTAGTPGDTQIFIVRELVPTATYYFAMRIFDSNPFPVQSVWVRGFAPPANTVNFSTATFVPRDPDPTTGFTAVTGQSRGEVDLSWTAPLNQNFVQISSYVIFAATNNAEEFLPLGAANAPAGWQAVASSRVYSPASEPGADETFTFDNLTPGVEYFFGIRSIDIFGEISPLDPDTVNLSTQKKAVPFGIQDIRDLKASTGTLAGSISLTWTTPRHKDQVPTFSYDIRASTLANIINDAQFDAAQPLSAFTGTPTKAFGSPGFGDALQITGLEIFTTYYFAIRVEDSSSPTKNRNVWVQNSALKINT
ncbi:MAG: hypothetical protein COB53_05810, partial [Elusimicrobia bacterium]